MPFLFVLSCNSLLLCGHPSASNPPTPAALPRYYLGLQGKAINNTKGSENFMPLVLFDPLRRRKAAKLQPLYLIFSSFMLLQVQRINEKLQSQHRTKVKCHFLPIILINTHFHASSQCWTCCRTVDVLIH